MKNLYLSISMMALALASGSTAMAQTAKPRPAKSAENLRSIRPVRTAHANAAENRGGANDECASAIPVTVASECSGSLATYDATAATQSLDPILCNGFTSPEANDLWFSFVATAALTTVQVEGTLSFDAVVEGFSGTCGDLASVGCADATFPPTSPTNTTETLTMLTEVGSTYYVRVYSYWQPVPVDFTFTLCIFSAGNAAPNDLCTSVTPVAIATGSSATFTGDNTDAFDTENLGLPSVWHAFTITECADVTLDYCGTASVFQNAFLNLFTSCPVVDGGVFPSSGFDLNICPDGNVTILYNAVPPGTYYYAVIRDDAAPAVGEYTVNVAVSQPTSYCAASLEQCDETIGRVAVGTIDNTSDCVAPGDVVDYTDQSTNIIQTEILPITVENGGVPYAENTVSVWVDWNQDQSFCNANELHILTTADEGVTFTGNIIAPPDALPGTTRMRVRMAYGMEPRACGTMTYGEIEDYSVNVLLGNGIQETANADWTVFPNPGNGDMSIRYMGAGSKATIELFDVTGRMVYQDLRAIYAGQRFELGLAGKLTTGSYTLRLATTDGRSEQRVVVQ